MRDPETQKRIADLAKTLREQGIAATESRAQEMATDIIQTEQKQQRAYDERKNRADLNPQQRAPVPKPSKQPEQTKEPEQTKQPTQPPSQGMRTGTIEGVDEEKSIGELLADADIEAEEPSKPVDAPEAPTEPAPEPEQKPNQPTEDAPKAPVEAPATAPAENKELDESMEELEEVAEEKSEPEKKSAEADVDLNQMFNFSKR